MLAILVATLLSKTSERQFISQGSITTEQGAFIIQGCGKADLHAVWESYWL